MHPHGHRADIVRNVGDLCRLPRIVHRKIRCGYDDVGIDISLKQFAVLRNHADSFAERLQVKRTHIPAVVVNCALLRLLKAEKKAKQCGFSAPGFSDNGNILTGFDLQTQIIHDKR